VLEVAYLIATISNLTVTAIGNDGHVSTWYDQSGNGNNATQATPASQPKIVDGGALVTLNWRTSDLNQME
jgi:hypothetical protein